MERKEIKQVLAQVCELIRELADEYGPNSPQVGDAYLKLHCAYFHPNGKTCPEDSLSFENSLVYHYLSEDPRERKHRLKTIESVLVGSLDEWKETDPAKGKHALFVLLDLAEHWKIMGDASRSEALAEQVAGLCQKYLDPTDSLTVSALVDLSAHCSKRGDLDKAQLVLTQALEICEANPEAMGCYGPRVLMNVASVVASRNQLPLAACHLDRALEVTEQVPEPDTYHLLEVLCNQAKVYSAMDQRGRFDQAATRALDIAREYWKCDQDFANECMMTLFGLYQSQGRFDEARLVSKSLAKLMTQEGGGRAR